MKYSALKGIHDIFPPEIYKWQKVESLAEKVFTSYGFQEIRPPIIESTDIFTRSIGETTDIVEKEMYTFSDKAGRSITLRPEGTAPAVRCYVENHLYNMPAPQKFFYSGPMFRYERPQAGRFRQFYQIGVEAFGISDPKIDSEILLMLNDFFESLSINNINIQINSIGCELCRPNYKKALKNYFSDKFNELCSDCKRRYEVNPLRILDCKINSCINLRKDAPRVIDFLCPECKDHFTKLQNYLILSNIKFTVNPDMVRGLNYYTRTTFEVTCENLGSQNAIAAGGRYDKLVEEFGGPPTPAIGFAIGMERLTSIIQIPDKDIPTPMVFIAAIGDDAELKALQISQKLRRNGYWVELSYKGQSLKSQMRKADRIKSKIVFIIGDEELKTGKLKWKSLYDGISGEISFSEIEDFIKAFNQQHQVPST
jgi:histidyl-tRNA synthetase